MARTPAPLERRRVPAVAAVSSRDELLAAYRTMLLSRKIDDKEIQLKNQTQAFFQISGAGHEAVLVAAGRQLRPGYDWFFPYYRDRALCLAIGVTPLEMFLSSVGSKDDPASGGRQMPSHWGSTRLNIPSQSSCVATQCLHAVGCAEAGVIYDRVTTIPNREARYHSDQLTYVSIGEGGTSEGEFWESLNTACTRKLPLLYLVEDNGYAISVPVEAQTPGGDISRLVESFPDLSVHRCDGTDYLDSYDTLEEAIAYVRARRGPALVHAKVIRPYSHSLSDDEKLYKTPAEREAEAKRDPLLRMSQFLVAEGLATEEELADLVTSVEREVARAADQALEAPKPDPRTATAFVYSPVVDPTSALFVSEPQPEGNPDTMLSAINKTLRDEMARDARIVDVRSGRGRRHARRGAGHGVRQGRRVQGDARAAARLRQRPGVQLAAGRGQHRRARGGHGAARPEAGGRDPVLRLHLARVHADPGRAVDDAVSLRATTGRARW